MKSGSSDLTTWVSFSIISFSSPTIGYSVRSPARSTTAAAHSMWLVAMLVSRSKDSVTKGAGKGSALSRPPISQESIMSTGYIPDPPTSCIRASATDGSVVSAVLVASGALSPVQRTFPLALMCGPRSRSSSRLWTNRMSALVTLQPESDSAFLTDLTFVVSLT